jgi:hypothetical protein
MVANVTTTVSAVRSVAISIDPESSTVVRGNTTTFVLTIINLGNANEVLSVELLGGATSWSNMSRASVDLKMNGSETVSITIDPGMLVDGNELVDGTHGFEVVVRSDDFMETVKFKLTVTTPEPPPPPPTSGPNDQPLFSNLKVPLVLLVVIVVCCVAVAYYLRRRSMGQSPEPRHQEYHEDQYPEEQASMDYNDEEMIYKESDIEEF